MSEKYSFSAQASAQKIRLPSNYFFMGCLIQKRVQTFFFKFILLMALLTLKGALSS
jgi:hypothetical protein